jgi:hypothetical protein
MHGFHHKSHRSASDIFVHSILLLQLVNPTLAACAGGYTEFANGNALRSAVTCVVSGSDCQSTNLDPAAKGANNTDPSNIYTVYGDISDWCTGLVEDFSLLFSNLVCFKS